MIILIRKKSNRKKLVLLASRAVHQIIIQYNCVNLIIIDDGTFVVMQLCIVPCRIETVILLLMAAPAKL